MSASYPAFSAGYKNPLYIAVLCMLKYFRSEWEGDEKMADIMGSATRYRQSNETIRKMTERAFGKAEDFSAKEMSGGFFSAVYLVEANGEKYVLKLAAYDAVKVMRHEKDYIPTEAKMLRMFNEKTDIPMPKLLYFDDSRDICKVPYFFMSYIDGKPLCETQGLTDGQISDIKREMGVITRKMCSIKMPHYGVPALPETFTDKNSGFTVGLFEMLVRDAEEKDIEKPSISGDELISLICSQSAALDAADAPCCAHTDTWDGNIMVRDGKLVGLIDFAAVYYADPLMSHDFHDFGSGPREDFLEGFGKSGFDRSERIRIQIYKLWQQLGMVVERGCRCYEDSNLYDWVPDVFANEVGVLKKMI